MRRLNITREQLRQELEENGDIPYLLSGVLTPAALRLTAETLNTMRYAGNTLESHHRTLGTERCNSLLYVLSATA